MQTKKVKNLLPVVAVLIDSSPPNNLAYSIKAHSSAWSSSLKIKEAVIIYTIDQPP